MPGRIGTSSPELGVPVAFADVSNLMGICEVASSEAGYSPELSYGSHLFQDLVEADIYYGALLEDRSHVYYNPHFVERFIDITAEVLPSAVTPSAGMASVATPSAAMASTATPSATQQSAKASSQFGKSASYEKTTTLVQVFDTSSSSLTLWHDLRTNTSICGLQKSVCE